MLRLASGLLAAAAALALPSAAGAAVITFTGARQNGQNLLPASYQPLLNGYTNDGGALGITIGWVSVGSSSRAVNSPVRDHTPGQNGSGIVAYDFGSSTMRMNFSADVELPSFWFANYQSGNRSITFRGLDATGATVLSLTRNYSQPVPYTWIQETGFAGVGIRSLVVSGAIYKQLDDITVNAFVAPTGGVPEPATWALLIAGMGVVGGAMRRRQTLAFRPANA